MRFALRALAAVLVIVAGLAAVLVFAGTQEGGRSVVADPPLPTASSAPSTTSTTEEPVTTTEAPEVVAPATNRIEQNNPAPAVVPSGDVWDRIAQCESGGDWALDNGNGYSGGLQIAGHEAATLSKASQIEWATEIQARQGWGAWPTCAAFLR